MIIRRIDDLGRVCIPAEIRREMGLKNNVPVSIAFDGKRIIVEKTQDACISCGTTEGLVQRSSGQPGLICMECLEDFNDGLPF